MILKKLFHHPNTIEAIIITYNLNFQICELILVKILTVSRHLEAYIEQKRRTKEERRRIPEERSADKKNESYPSGNRRVSFDGKSVKSQD